MPTTKRSPSELVRLGESIFDRQIRSTLRPEDDGKFVALDVDSGEYELDEDDYTAVMRLRSRKPEAEICLLRAGYPTTYRIGVVR